MALAFVQESGIVASSGSPQASVLTFPGNVTAGNALIVWIAIGVIGSRTFSVSDNIHGTTGWTRITESAGLSESVEIWYRANHDGGSVSVTVAHDEATGIFGPCAGEFSGFGASIAVDAFDNAYDPSTNTSTHQCSASGVTSANEVLAVCAAMLSASATEINPGTDYTEIPNGFSHGQRLYQWRVFASGATNEVGAFTSTGTTRNVDAAVIALLSGAAVLDTTPPTLSGAATATDGATITAALSESGCVADGGGTSGSGGFTLSGTSATVASWAISGTTLTLTLSGTVLSSDTVTYAYARASTTDDIKDAAGNYLADFSGAAVTNNVSAGTASAVFFHHMQTQGMA